MADTKRDEVPGLALLACYMQAAQSVEDFIARLSADDGGTLRKGGRDETGALARVEAQEMIGATDITSRPSTYASLM